MDTYDLFRSPVKDIKRKREAREREAREREARERSEREKREREARERERSERERSERERSEREREKRERERSEREREARERERAQTTTHNNVGEFKNNIQTKYISKSFPKTQQIKFSSLRELNSKLKKIIRRIENKN